MTRADLSEPFAPLRSWADRAGDLTRPVRVADVRRDLEARGFDVPEATDDEVKAVRSQFHGELLTRIDTVVWVRRVDEVDEATIEADRERLVAWAREHVPNRFRSRMTVLAYLAGTATPEARAIALAGPQVRSGRFDGIGIRDREGLYVFEGIRLRGLAFFPLLNFLVLTSLVPQPRPEPRIVWVWAFILTVGQIPLVATLGWIALMLARARGWLP